MNSITSFIQRTGAALSARARASVAPVAVVPAFVGANPAFGTGGLQHMNTLWLGGTAETGCVTNTYVTKRITTGSLDEVST